MVLSILIKESGRQMRSRLTEEFAKGGKTHVHHTSYIAIPEEKQIDTRPKLEWQIYFSAENLLEFNPMVMNYKIRHNNNKIGQRSTAVHGQTTLSITICGGRKMEKHDLDMRGYVQW